MSSYGTFTKAGWVQEAGTPSEAVAFEYNGWTRLPDEDAAAIEASLGPNPPPLGGAGSGADAWAAYAGELGVPVSEDAKRDDIVQAVRDAGHPVGDEQ